VKLPALSRERLIEFGRKRAKQGAGPATLAIDMSFIRTIITHAAAVHGIEVSAEEARLARVALSHLNLVGKSKERDRRATQDELGELIEYFETNHRQFTPMGRIVRYAVATTLRQEEICKPEWPLVDMKKRLVVIQDRKDPRNKDGNDQKVPLLNLTGYDAWAVVTLVSAQDPDSELALEQFCTRSAEYVAVMAVSLGGLDLLVFTGGIGENSPLIRENICEKLRWLGVELDSVANNQGAARISNPNSQVAVKVIPTNEEEVIVMQTATLMAY
jgi:hypothetical protein